jgi:hypothetical protein
VATAVWLFNYADTVADMTAMFAAIRANLVPGGRLVAITIGPGYDPSGPSWEPYGLRVAGAGQEPRRTRLVMDVLATPTVQLGVSRWDQQVYDEASRAAGFASLTWHPARIPEDVLRARGADYWRAYQDNPFLAAFECR